MQKGVYLLISLYIVREPTTPKTASRSECTSDQIRNRAGEAAAREPRCSREMSRIGERDCSAARVVSNWTRTVAGQTQQTPFGLARPWQAHPVGGIRSKKSGTKVVSFFFVLPKLHCSLPYLFHLQTPRCFGETGSSFIIISTPYNIIYILIFNSNALLPCNTFFDG